MEIFLYILLGISILWVIIVYNSLISLRNQVRNSFSGIDVQLKRRNDLIPNLIKTVKGYSLHEKDLFERITKIRTSLMSAVDKENIKKLAKNDEILSNSLKKLFAVTENYPDLKANQNFLDLQEQLIKTEDQISASRRIYNSNVMVFNSKLQIFPNNLIANLLNFKEFDFFRINPKEKETPNVNL